ncbi:Asp-tRNA(Asn)/Glu-tRNA(Gln) amidotransferase subunit GatC [Boudabousia marimammalium]|uniref:Aspartyl/glutamyl-tRNA(Asn/Gln) amidotransferase subunit C n=1 Tax=Boudabousia marimammalium TaxID=156892 RepID=A0A1Q5PLV6_9ACTO|nr:Asp-tRNA(Asn)/Glu-tRNA(Gln) amidotransferase subunit GatC [Boudabousia marimammalium]OKL48041.1 asparaginyl/glutamyl-tRNA amidotransferase subunit C [Boudabousia marimammalium]
MSNFTSSEVMRLAQMARIAITESEAEEYASELGKITQSVETVQQVATPDVPATSHPMPLTNVMREDVVGETLDRDEVLAAAPMSQNGMFKVAQILGEE